MKGPVAQFWTTAMLGYAIVVATLAGGMIIATEDFDDVASQHVTRIRAEEEQITLAERLRWSGEAIVSTGRGYLISGDPAFLARLNEAQTKFDNGVQSLLAGASDLRTIEVMDEIELNALAFRGLQERLVASMHEPDVGKLAMRFDLELVPLQKTLVDSLDRMIDYKETAIDGVYAHVAAERVRLRTRIIFAVAALVLGTLLIAGYIARLLGRSYRKEQEAVEVSRRAIAARDDVLGIVAHDLRNPLSSILIRGSLLAEIDDIEMARKHGRAIESVSRRMEGLIKSMLDVATIESGHFTVSPEPCSVDELLDEITEMFRGLAANKQIRIERDAALPNARVRADRERILQVLGNLVGNAVKFTHDGGSIALAAEQDGDTIRFRVSDDGPGIDSQHLDSVFTRFWKHETEGKKGTGLGLFIAKGIVDAHGGRIWAQNGPTHGATFFFTLPRASPPESEPVA